MLCKVLAAKLMKSLPIVYLALTAAVSFAYGSYKYKIMTKNGK